jgi:tetratricopeptide (TPR) repeat protein
MRKHPFESAPFIAIAAALVSCAIIGSSAAAQESTRIEAREQFEKGLVHYDAGEYEEALRAFQEAYRLRPHPTARVNMANCYDKMNRPVEAIFHFERFMADPEAKKNKQQVKEVRKALKRLRGQIAEVRLNVVPDGAEVVIDDRKHGQSPIMEAIRLVTGEHVIDVKHEGYRPARRRIDLSGGEEREVFITLKKGEAPEAVPVTAGEDEAVSDAASDEEEEEESGPTDDSLLEPTPVLLTGALTAGLAVATTVTAVMALGADADYNAYLEEERLDKQDRLDADYTAARAKNLALATDILLACTVVSAGVTAYFLFFADDEEPDVSGDISIGEEEEARLSPMLGQDAAGVALDGVF